MSLYESPEFSSSDSPLATSFWRHLYDMRSVFLRILLVFFCVAFLIWGRLEDLLVWIYRPYHQAYTKLSLSPDSHLVATNVFEVITTNLKMSGFLSFLLIFPYALWEVWRFVSPALYPHEKRLFRRVALLSTHFFYIGLVSSYLFFVPFLFEQSLSWTLKFAQPLISFHSYVHLLMSLSLMMGLVFQIPVIFTLFSALGWVHSHLLTRNRKWILLCSLILSAVIAPPDLFSQLILTLPILFLFECAVWGMKIVEKKRFKAQAHSETAGEVAAFVDVK